MTILGTDVSHYEGDIDLAKMKLAGASFVIFKVSETWGPDSTKWTDGNFLKYWALAKEAGLFRGAYMFLNPDVAKTSAIDQARYFCNLIKNDPPELPPIVDYEYEAPGVPSDLIVHLQDAISEINDITNPSKDPKRIPMIYTGPDFWTTHGSADPYWKQFPLWEAHWTANATPIPMDPWGNGWLLWQWTAKGNGPEFGVEALDIDLNRFNGTLDDWNKFVSVAAQPPAPHPTTCPTCGQYWPPDNINNYRVKSGNNLNVHLPDRYGPTVGLLMAGKEVCVKNYAATPWYVFFEPTPTFAKGGWVYKSYLEKIV